MKIFITLIVNHSAWVPSCYGQ